MTRKILSIALVAMVITLVLAVLSVENSRNKSSLKVFDPHLSQVIDWMPKENMKYECKISLKKKTRYIKNEYQEFSLQLRLMIDTQKVRIYQYSELQYIDSLGSFEKLRIVYFGYSKSDLNKIESIYRKNLLSEELFLKFL
jgi:hypothetical protein